MATGGSVESITLNGRTFSVAADADTQRKLGGFENEVEPNGDATARLIKTRVPWGLTDIVVSIDDLAGDPEFLQDLANSLAFFPTTITYASGAIAQGTGQITGEVQTSSQKTTASVALMGSGVLTFQ